MDQIAGLLIVLAVVMWIFIACRYSKKARFRREFKRLKGRHAHLIDAKVRQGRGRRFDCPRCGSTAPCKGCLLGNEG